MCVHCTVIHTTIPTEPAWHATLGGAPRCCSVLRWTAFLRRVPPPAPGRRAWYPSAVPVRTTAYRLPWAAPGHYIHRATVPNCHGAGPNCARCRHGHVDTGFRLPPHPGGAAPQGGAIVIMALGVRMADAVPRPRAAALVRPGEWPVVAAHQECGGAIAAPYRAIWTWLVHHWMPPTTPYLQSAGCRCLVSRCESLSGRVNRVTEAVTEGQASGL
jgi:hypothetical protein